MTEPRIITELANLVNQAQEKSHYYVRATCEKAMLAIGCLMAEDKRQQRKIDKLKRLLLLTDDSVSNAEVGDLQIKQWNEFLKEFPDEAEQLNKHKE